MKTLLQIDKLKSIGKQLKEKLAQIKKPITPSSSKKKERRVSVDPASRTSDAEFHTYVDEKINELQEVSAPTIRQIIFKSF